MLDLPSLLLERSVCAQLGAGESAAEAAWQLAGYALLECQAGQVTVHLELLALCSPASVHKFLRSNRTAAGRKGLQVNFANMDVSYEIACVQLFAWDCHSSTEAGTRAGLGLAQSTS